MPSRAIVAKELAEICKITAHPDRIRMIEQLNSGPKDVKSLAEVLELSASRVSQHLALLRAHRLVEEHREGRQHIYNLTQPKLARWILDALEFIEIRPSVVSEADIKAVREYWSNTQQQAAAS